MSLPLLLLSLLLFLGPVACTAIPPAGKLLDGHLRPCPSRPNCVTSDSTAADSIAPITFTGRPEEAWQQMQQVIRELGGEIVESRPTYLWATFTSPLWHFVDDLELRLDPLEKKIHFRSGARLGFSDLGVNGRRLATIRQRFTARTTATPAGGTD